MFYAYVLRSRIDGKLYIGHTEDLKHRLKQHNAGDVDSTRHRVPFDLVYSKEVATRSEARWQERKWKTAWGHKQLAELLGSNAGVAQG